MSSQQTSTRIAEAWVEGRKQPANTRHSKMRPMGVFIDGEFQTALVSYGEHFVVAYRVSDGIMVCESDFAGEEYQEAREDAGWSRSDQPYKVLQSPTTRNHCHQTMWAVKRSGYTDSGEIRTGPNGRQYRFWRRA
jgi:hypothetical protein